MAPHTDTRHSPDRVAAASAAVTVPVLTALTALRERASTRRHRDAGLETLEYVVIAAGVVALAILLVNHLGPVVQRYMSRIQ